MVFAAFYVKACTVRKCRKSFPMSKNPQPCLAPFNKNDSILISTNREYATKYLHFNDIVAVVYFLAVELDKGEHSLLGPQLHLVVNILETKKYNNL